MGEYKSGISRISLWRYISKHEQHVQNIDGSLEDFTLRCTQWVDLYLHVTWLEFRWVWQRWRILCFCETWYDGNDFWPEGNQPFRKPYFFSKCLSLHSGANPTLVFLNGSFSYLFHHVQHCCILCISSNLDETKTYGLPTKRSCESRGYRYKGPQFSIKFLSSKMILNSYSTLCASSSFCREQKGDNIIFRPNNSCFCVLLENKHTNTLDPWGAFPPCFNCSLVQVSHNYEQGQQLLQSREFNTRQQLRQMLVKRVAVQSLV